MKPNFLFIGLGKTGSSLIDKVIRRHPQIFLSEVRKELMFFNVDAHFKQGEAFFDDLLSGHRGEPWVGDISPGYLRKPGALERIAAFYGGDRPRIIIGLRNPVTQFFSYHCQALKTAFFMDNLKGPIPGSFDEEVRRRRIFTQIVDRLETAFQTFDAPGAILPLVYETDICGGFPAERRIYEFLGVDATERFFDPRQDRSVNAGLMPVLLKPAPVARTVDVAGRETLIPAGHVGFVSVDACSRSIAPDHPRYAEALAACDTQHLWRVPPGEQTIAALREEFVLPVRRLVESTFGLDLSCWDRVAAPRYQTVAFKFV